jgi:hypothetical protein
MNDYEISKLKKELQRKQELLKEEREDHKQTKDILVGIQAVTITSPRNAIDSTANSSSTDKPSKRSTSSWQTKSNKSNSN